MQSIPRALTIAGSDSGGCAGIQADLKTFSALEVHGMSVITSVTAQDTRRVYLSSDLPLKNIELQIEAVIQDIGVDAVKTGMLSSGEIIELTVEKLVQFRIKRLVVDPVMVSSGGDPLLRPDAIEVLKTQLFPHALIVTPNLQEAEFLTGDSITDLSSLKEVMHKILDLGPQSVLVKGGHFQDSSQSTDYFFDGKVCIPFCAPRIETQNTHGSGCTLASAITAYLAHGLDLEESVARAKEFVTEAIRHSFSLGMGRGPLAHFWKYWSR